MAEYDLIIIGGGPGGYVCAIRAAQLGLKTACVEGRGALGGTCLNVGCIPSKALLHSSEMLHEAEGNFAKMGIVAKSVSADLDQMHKHKASVVEANTKGIEFLFKKNKVDYIKGWGKITGPGEVKVGEDTHKAKNIVIATGSEPATLPFLEIDEKRIVSSTGALELPKVPKKLVVIGGGVIGLELGSVWRRLGSEVTVIEYLDEITPGADAEVAKTFRRTLTKQGIKFELGAAVTGIETLKTKLKIAYKRRKDDSEHQIDADIVLVATGRRPVTRGLGLEALGVATERGFILTDAHWRTNVEGVYAIGDVTEGPMLAHKAEDEGMAAAEQIAKGAGHVNYAVIPGVIYTAPEVASVGLTEEALKSAGRAYKVGKFPFTANGRAKANLVTDGFVKLLADERTGQLLGAHIIGPGAGDLIHEICVGMEYGATAEGIARTCHAHPTYSEAVREAALALCDGAIHF
ncbi:dihydrolipoyl dehydrogenase [Pikeienuella piscinae]|uniref:Dihydrolipoyl dehydrogenase n=1 Tax=Pikeienuella piscinae TaxID=2748098 RepID=A0A7L5C2Q5_9RHOB|nr:dihydrolipoyl dehydrogenase [Pikeienuella piscinae]QIE56836.1 dihydrolipoyl dehydrogenase [Pikeienuella piscinae]